MFEEDIKLLKLDVMLRDNALVELRKKFEKAKKERDDLKLTLEKFQTSSKNLSKLLESQVYDKTGLGFDSQVFNSQVFDCEELHNHESDNSMPKSPENDRYKTGEGYHAVPPLYTRTFMPPNPDLVFNDAPTSSKSVANVFNVQSSINKASKDRESVKKVEHPKQAENLRTNNQKSREMVQKPVWNHAMRVNHQNSVRMTHPHSNKNVVPTSVLTRSRLVSLNAARPVPTAIPQSTMKSPWPTVIPQSTVKSPWPIKNVVNKGNKGNVEKTSANLVWKPKCKVLDHVSRLTSASITLKEFDYTDALGRSKNISFLTNSKEINEGYVTFGGNPKGGKISGKDTECAVLSSDYKLPDENHVLLRVTRENNMYNVDLQNVVASEDLTCLFAKATLDEIKREFSVARTPQQNEVAKRKNKTLIEAARTMLADSLLHIPFWAEAVNTACYVQNMVLVTKPHNKTPYELLLENENDVYVSANGNDKTGNKKHDEKSKRDDKGKTHVDLLTGVRDLRAEFKAFSSNSTNRVNVISAPVNAIGLNLTNSTNTFNTASLSVNAVSLNFEITRKYSFVDPSKYPDDPDMPELEYIVYLDNKEHVGAEADFSNLETNIFGRTQEEGIDYDEVFTPVARIEAIRLFLTYASFMGFMELCKAFEKLMKDKFQMSSMGELTFFLGLQLKQKNDGIFISQDKYVAEILKKFSFTHVKSASTPIETEKPLLKDPDSKDVDVHIYRSMIRSLMYLTSAKPDIMFVVCACVRFQLTPKVSHLHAIKKNLVDDKKVVISEDVIRIDLHLDDADGVECFLNEEIFIELSRMGYEKPPPKLTFSKACSMASVVIYLATGGCIQIGRKIEAIDADEDITLVDVEKDEEVVTMDAEPRGRIDQEDVNAASKGVSATKPTVFDDEEETFKKLRTAEALGSEYTQEILSNDPKEMSKEDVQNMLEIVLVSEFKVEALQIKYPIIDWEIHTEGSRTYWKIIRVGGITEAYQSFEDMLKGFDIEDLVAIWNLVKKKFSSAVPSVDKEKALWVELKRLFEPDAYDLLWKLQRYMHCLITWKLYTNCRVHQVSSTTRMHDMFMLTKKDYPLSNAVMILMLSAKLKFEEDNEMARDLVMKIFIKANKPKEQKFGYIPQVIKMFKLKKLDV
nr:hypothetical protein [Tanacetum cinerariifolium]